MNWRDLECQTINPWICNSLYLHSFLINHYCLFVCLFENFTNDLHLIRNLLRISFNNGILADAGANAPTLLHLNILQGSCTFALRNYMEFQCSSRVPCRSKLAGNNIKNLSPAAAAWCDWHRCCYLQILVAVCCDVGGRVLWCWWPCVVMLVAVCCDVGCRVLWCWPPPADTGGRVVTSHCYWCLPLTNIGGSRRKNYSGNNHNCFHTIISYSTGNCCSTDVGLLTAYQ